MHNAHMCFCAPINCTDDGAATVLSRLLAQHGIALEFMPPNSEIEIREVRHLARWEDVKLDFLVAGFARSGTHSVRNNLAQHPEVRIAEDELTFNWGYVPLKSQVQAYHNQFEDDAAANDEAPRPLLRGGKGEGVAFSPHILRLASRIPGLRLIVMVREPVEWLESLYNLRRFECQVKERSCGKIPSLDEVVFEGSTLEDVNVKDVFLSSALQSVIAYFPPSAGRLLLLEFELLRTRPREAFDRICTFLGISVFPPDFEFKKYAFEDRVTYESRGERVSFCSEPFRPALEALRGQLAMRSEHAELAKILASAGAQWVSSRLVLNRTHCD